MARPPAPPLRLSKTERTLVGDIALSVSLPYRAMREARGLLMAADAAAVHPERFTQRPTPPKVPTKAWINKPTIQSS